MVTSPAQNASRVTHLPPNRSPLAGPPPGRSEPRSPLSSAHGGLVVRLELPDVDVDDQQPGSDHSRSEGRTTSRPTIDPEHVARAVENLLRVLAPSLTPQVRVELIAAPTQPTLGRPGRTEDLQLDLGGRTLSVDGQHVVLTRREFELLAYLQQRQGVALSRRELMNAVWQTGYLDGDRTIDVHVRRLRLKLGRHADRLSTLRGYGYRFD